MQNAKPNSQLRGVTFMSNVWAARATIVRTRSSIECATLRYTLRVGEKTYLALLLIVGTKRLVPTFQDPLSWCPKSDTPKYQNT